MVTDLSDGPEAERAALRFLNEVEPLPGNRLAQAKCTGETGDNDRFLGSSLGNNLRDA